MMLTSDIQFITLEALPPRATLAMQQFSDQTNQELPSQEGAGNLEYFGDILLFVYWKNGIVCDHPIKGVLNERKVIVQNDIHTCCLQCSPAELIL